MEEHLGGGMARSQVQNWQNGSVEPDPELYDAGPPPGSGRVALFAVMIALVLGTVFFWFNTSQQVTKVPPSATSQQSK